MRRTRRADRLHALQTDVDCRLLDLWEKAGIIDEWTISLVGEFMRAAYGVGYCDAARGDRGLFVDHGYPHPRRG